MRTTSLGQEVSFTQILPLLNVPVHSTVLPAIVNCPRCWGNWLYIYRDAAESQDWCYCRDCGVFGDMIELAAAAWKLDIGAAVRKIREASLLTTESLAVPAALDDYQKQHVRFRQRVTRFWQETQKNAADNHTVMGDLLRAFELPSIHGDWSRHGGQFIGLTTRETFLKHIMAGKIKQTPTRVRRDFGLSSENLAGPGWEHVLIVPFYDLPGRICGFLGIGRNKKQVVEKIFIPVTPIGYSRGRREGGLAMLGNITLKSPAHKHVFAITDIFTAISMQIRHLRETSLPLPIVVPYLGPTAETDAVWGNLRSTNVICWTPHGGIDGLIHAKRANAQVASLQLTGSTIEYNLLHQTAGDWLHQVRKTATPWSAALRTQLRNDSREVAESTLLRMEFSNEAYKQFIAGCDADLKQRVEGMRDHVDFSRRVRYSGRTIHERGGAWYFDNDEVVCDAIVRIEQVITSSRHRTYYKGVIKFQEREIPFLEQAQTIEKRGFEWLLSYVRDIANGGVISYAPQFTRRLAGLAIIFHTPDQVNGVEQVGWDVDRQHFQLPKYAIKLGGEVDTASHCLFDGELVPGRRLPQPDGNLPSRHTTTLSAVHDESALVWGTAAAVLHRLISEPLRRPGKGLLFDGEGAKSIGETAAILLGCPELLYDPREPVVKTAQRVHPHAWPAVLRCPPSRTLTPGAWLTTPEAANLLVAQPSVTVQVLGLRQTWNVLRCPRKLGSLQLTTDAVPYILPHYLQDVCRRRFLTAEGNNLLTLGDVVTDLADWFGGQGGNRAAVLNCKTMLEAAESTTAARYFVRLVAYAVGQGVARSGFASRVSDADVSYLEDEPYVWIAQNPISQTAEEFGGLPLDVLPVSQVLSTEGALADETSRQGALGWLVHREWWDTQWKSFVQKD